jgi:Na+-transporting NADH:ubiquinone oxidoreductase subunit C
MENSNKKTINVNGNTYTVIYSIVIVVIVAVLLTVAATSLKPAQQRNMQTEKKENILKTAGKAQDVRTATNKAQYIEEEYEKYIVESYLVNEAGNKINGNAFNTELKAELAKPANERSLPVFVCKSGEQTRYVIQLYGKGLWGPIWGYVAFEDDFNTVAGVVFDHGGETPGLGAEITTAQFQKPFAGKQIFDGNNLVSITVQKPGKTLNNHTVDGISGGTITSRGVQNMFAENLKLYSGFFNKMKSESKKNNLTEID